MNCLMSSQRRVVRFNVKFEMIDQIILMEESQSCLQGQKTKQSHCQQKYGQISLPLIISLQKLLTAAS
jgi:hypothetical protein